MSAEPPIHVGPNRAPIAEPPIYVRLDDSASDADEESDDADRENDRENYSENYSENYGTPGAGRYGTGGGSGSDSDKGAECERSDSGQSISNSNSTFRPFVKMAQNLGLRCVLGAAPWVLWPKHV